MSSGVSLGCGWLTLTPSRMDCTTLGRAEAWRWWTSRDSKLMMGLARAICGQWGKGGGMDGFSRPATGQLINL